MTTALPIDRPWYRQLLAIAVAMGLIIGLLGLVYLGITGELTDRIFGDPRIDTWSGDWWWIPFIAMLFVGSTGGSGHLDEHHLFD